MNAAKNAQFRVLLTAARYVESLDRGDKQRIDMWHKRLVESVKNWKEQLHGGVNVCSEEVPSCDPAQL